MFTRLLFAVRSFLQKEEFLLRRFRWPIPDRSHNGTVHPFQKFTYTFDSNNKITKMVSSYIATVETFTYTYSCND